MIVLDTNQLQHVAFPHGAILGMLRKIADLNGRTLAIPEMVAIEHVAHYQHEVEEQHRQALRALRALGKAFDKDFGKEVREQSPAAAGAARREALEKVFTILPTPGGAALEALRREANRQPPAEQSWKDSEGKEVRARGARDVAIWLTVLEAARGHGEPVWFLTQDADFRGPGSGDDFHAVLRAEASTVLMDNSEMLRLLPQGIEQLLSELAEEISPIPENLSDLLHHQDVAGAVINELIYGPVIQRSVPAVDDTAFHSLGTRLFVDNIVRSKAYRVGDSTWLSAQVRWKVSRSYTPRWRTDPEPSEVAFVFDTTLLVQTDGTDVLAAEVAATAAATDVRYQLPAVAADDPGVVEYRMLSRLAHASETLDPDHTTPFWHLRRRILPPDN
ncbi:PIN domain-containing protein [Streptomyces sp. NPDC047023]|uniref:PIN domain-containing protein n=1 Tax=Streptomyces sp. NPDC047023 TaxID=3155139 RepID=UPI0033FCEE79